MSTRKPPRELYQGKRKIKIGSRLKWGRSYGSVYDIDFKKKEVELDFGNDSFPLQFHELGLSEQKVETDDIMSVDLRAFNPGRLRKNPPKKISERGRAVSFCFALSPQQRENLKSFLRTPAGASTLMRVLFK